MDINNKLFSESFNISKWKNQDKIEFLLSNLDLTERSILNYLENITEDFPNLTDHSLAHSRKLWDYAEIITGDLHYLNPIEAYVLHLAFLIHDAGMCYSILDNKKDIESDPLYLDYLKRNGNTITTKEEALFYTVRQRHGDYAIKVATEKLREEEFLISNIDLREELGLIIGKIAKSHTCNVSYIENEFGSKYITPKFPTDWAIDCQKLAYVLRTADAAHIDNLRTPKTLKMISEIPGVSKDHWTFQKKLGFPTLGEDNLLIYSTNNPFRPEEQKAWWFCFEALSVLDAELKKANEHFTTKRQKEFAARGVKSIENTLELGKKYIRTENWFAIDTRIQVSNPVHIASELGGVKLYGNKNIAVRELIQNSIDAINLHRLITGQSNTDVGEINISLSKENADDYYLTITDNGIGMSQVVLSNELLDFGGSYWKSDRFKTEFQGIEAQGFNSIGQFGIGFFSVFMIGSNIQITSWRFGRAINDMMTLDFFDGLNSNPILRTPTEEESRRVKNCGTSIRIKLHDNPFLKDGIVNINFQKAKLDSLVKYFVPSPNVRINIIEVDGEKSVIEPHSVENMNVGSILNHLYLYKRDRYASHLEELQKFELPLFELSDSNKIYARLTLLPPIGRATLGSTAIVMSKGIRVNENINDFAGYIYTSDIVSIKRDTYTKEIPYDVLKSYALKQKEYIEVNRLIPLFSSSYLALLLTFNFLDDSFPLLNIKKDGIYSGLNISQFRDYLKHTKKFKIYREGNFQSARELTCDGLLMKFYSNPYVNIIKDEDKDLLVNYEDFIDSIIKNEWREYSTLDIPTRDEDSFRMDYPYSSIKEFTKN